jgi:L-fuculose-phosphate aldolase
MSETMKSDSAGIAFAKERQSIVDLCMELSRIGFLAGVGGNVALRLSDSELAVTPSAADYYTMKARDICILNIYTLELLDKDNSRSPSVESALHAALLLRRPDLRASVHTHQPLASVAALIHRSIPLLKEEDRALLGKEVVLVNYGPSGSSLLVAALQKAIRNDINSYLLRNHGLVCAAQSLDLALKGAKCIEKAAAAYLLELIHTAEKTPLPPALLARIENLLKEAMQI